MRKDFEEIYNEIYEECIMDLKQVKKRINLSVGIVLLILIVLNCFKAILISIEGRNNEKLHCFKDTREK